jgi:hypothetical protein
MMIFLTKSLAAWGTPEFPGTLKQEILALDTDQLPLQQGLSTGNYALGDGLDLMIMNCTDDPEFIHTKAGIFYSSIDAGCSCDGDPTHTCDENQFCEVQIDIDKANGNATISMIPEEDNPQI